MPCTLPSYEEITVQEIEVSTPALKAGAFHLGKYCEFKNNEYMLCREEGGNKDPRMCLNEGKEVTACALDFFRKIKKTCLEEFNQYANCLDKSSIDFEFRQCRNTQAIYDMCVLEKLEIERPDFGYYMEAKIHDSKRPKPVKEPLEFPDARQPVPPPPTGDRPRARYGGRHNWNW